MTRKILSISFFFTFIVFEIQAQNQLNFDVFSQDSNSLNIQFMKLNNYLQFEDVLNFNYNSKFGNLDLQHEYHGSATTSESSSAFFHDNQILQFKYYLPFTKNLGMILRQNWLSRSNSRSIGVNEFESLNGLLGVTYTDNKLISSAAGGVSQYNQMGINSLGSIIQTESKLNNLEIDGYILNSDLFGEYFSINNDRSNSIIKFNAHIIRNYGDDNTLGLGVNYKYLNNDYLSLINDPFKDHIVKNRKEDSIGINLNIDYGILDELNGSVNIYVDNLDVSNSYNSFFESLTESAVFRDIDKLDIGFSGDLDYRTDKYEHIFRFSISNRSEENYILNKYSLPETELIRLREIESQLDNTITTNRLLTTMIYNINPNDTLNATAAISLTKYDTPSQNNNDDRDEFNAFINFGYKHRFSKILLLSADIQLQLGHFVYLKSQRSAGNYWYRILKFSPNIQYDLNTFSMHPRFEIMANYTVYDYEGVIQNIQNYSFRQISYRDTMIFRINEKYSIQAKIFSRYYETGILFWDTFEETPQKGNLETQIKNIVFFQPERNIQLGFGLRYYYISQSGFKWLETLVKNSLFELESIGPETVISYRLNNRSMLILNGWYEFQTINKNLKRQIPNLFLTTKIFF